MAHENESGNIARVPSGFHLGQHAENRKESAIEGAKKMIESILGHTEFEGTSL